MAEVRIDIIAEDKASSELEKLAATAEGVAGSVGALSDELGRASESAASLATGMQAFLSALVEAAELKIGLDVSGAMDSVQGLSAALSGVDLERELVMDVSGALSGAASVVEALEAIPDVTYKTVVIQYMTEASPVRPFTEGMQYIKGMMDSLPTEGNYKVRFDGLGSNKGTQTSQAPQTTQPFSPTINISGLGGLGGGSGSTEKFARELDRELASLWRYGRSELRRAMAQ